MCVPGAARFAEAAGLSAPCEDWARARGHVESGYQYRAYSYTANDRGNVSLHVRTHFRRNDHDAAGKYRVY